MNNIASQAYKLKMTIKSLEKQYDGLMIALKESYNSGQTCWGSYKMVISIRPGTVEYGKIPQLQGVDLDQYRKADIQIYKLEYTGQEDND